MPPPKDHRFNSQRIALAETRRWLRIRQDSPFNAPSVDDRLDLMLRLERSTPRVSVGYRAETGYARSRGASLGPAPGNEPKRSWSGWRAKSASMVSR